MQNAHISILAIKAVNRVRLLSLTIVMLLATSLTGKAGLVITSIFDGSIKSDPNAPGIEATINAAISVFENKYSNPVSVTIEFQEGSALGESDTGFLYTENYHTFYTGLVAEDANPAAIAGLTARDAGNSWLNPATDSLNILVKPANLRALGLSGAPLCNVTGSSGSLTCGNTSGGPNAIDGIISLNTAITYPPQSNNGSNYSLMATTEHEIGEILGMGSALPGTSASSGTVSASNPMPDDLFRYSASGTLTSLAVNCASAPVAAYFSYSGTTDIAQFNNACNGGDFGDWQSTPIPSGVAAQVQDAFAYPGQAPLYGPSETAAMTAIGWVDPPANAPEPETWFLLLSSLAVFIWARPRRRA